MKRRETASDHRQSLQDEIFSRLPVINSGHLGLNLDQVHQVLNLKGPKKSLITPDILYKLGCLSIVQNGRVLFFAPKR